MNTVTKHYGRCGALFRGLVPALLCGLALPAAAYAQTGSPAEVPIGEGLPPNQLPAPRSDNDTLPPVPAPTVPLSGLTRQAGVGGTQAYGRAGVMELGGAAGFSAATNYSRFELSPSIGIFVIDNLELSLLGSFSHFRVGAPDNRVTATEIKALFEPSLHLPISQVVFGFAGLGAGFNYISGQEAGLAFQPRLGMNLLIGRSGVLTPAISVAYSTVEALRTEAGRVLAVQTSYGMNIGYTVMW
jgi:hypothetical protein